jgi:transcription elongation factor GreA
MATHAVNGTGARSNEKEKIPLTREGYEEKKARLTWLITERRQQVADYIHEAKEAGDVSESSAYEDAKNIQAMVEGEIQELQRVLENAVIIEAPTHVNGQRIVQIGSTVTVQTPSGTDRDFTIVSTHEANSTTNKLSDQSPVGKALLGRKEGDKVDVTLPNGNTVLYTVKKVAFK